MSNFHPLEVVGRVSEKQLQLGDISSLIHLFEVVSRYRDPQFQIGKILNCKNLAF